MAQAAIEAAMVRTALNSKFLSAIINPIASWYVNAMTYRQYGLRYDDIVMEENDPAQEALRRLPPQEMYDRHFRHKVAIQLSLQKHMLPKSEWTTDEQDKPYLQELLAETKREAAERDAYDHPARGMF